MHKAYHFKCTYACRLLPEWHACAVMYYSNSHGLYLLPEGPKNLTMNSFSPPRMVTSCLLSILYVWEREREREGEGRRERERERKRERGWGTWVDNTWPILSPLPVTTLQKCYKYTNCRLIIRSAGPRSHTTTQLSVEQACQPYLLPGYKN